MRSATRIKLLLLAVAATLPIGIGGCGPGVFDPGATSYYRIQEVPATGPPKKSPQPAQTKEAHP